MYVVCVQVFAFDNQASNEMKANGLTCKPCEPAILHLETNPRLLTSFMMFYVTDRDGRSRASSIKSIISRDSGNASLPSLGNDGGYSASHHDDYMYEVDTQNLERVSIPDSKIVLDEEVYKHGSRHGSENLFSRGSLNKLLRELHHLRRKHAVEAELSQDMNDEPGYITTVRIKRQR